MEITSSYQVEILSNADMKSTVQIYRRALAFVIDVCNKELQHIKYVDERLERHLCNLHNEVFEAAESRINTECSLIICEGISKLYGQQEIKTTFPHYM